MKQSTVHVSFVVPCYNGSRTIDRSIQSILNQITNHQFEVIVVLNACSDNSAELVSKYPVKVVIESIQGRSQARNVGLLMARGRFIAFIDCDTVLEPEWLSTMLSDFSLPKVVAVQSTVELKTDSTSELLRFSQQKITDAVRASSNAFNWPAPFCASAACMYDTEFLKQHQIRFNTELYRSEDNDFTWQCIINHGAVAYSTARARVYLGTHDSIIKCIIRNFVQGYANYLLISIWLADNFVGEAYGEKPSFSKFMKKEFSLNSLYLWALTQSLYLGWLTGYMFSNSSKMKKRKFITTKYVAYLPDQLLLGVWDPSEHSRVATVVNQTARDYFIAVFEGKEQAYLDELALHTGIAREVIDQDFTSVDKLAREYLEAT